MKTYENISKADRKTRQNISKYTIVEIYYMLGMIEDSKKIAAILGYNYPESIWYEKSYNIVGDTNFKSNDVQNWADKLLNKVLN